MRILAIIAMVALAGCSHYRNVRDSAEINRALDWDYFLWWVEHNPDQLEAENNYDNRF